MSMSKINCTAYITTTQTKGISPMYQVSIEIEGDEELVNQVKDLLQDNIQLQDLPQVLNEFFDPKIYDHTGTSYSIKNSNKSVSLNFDMFNTLEKVKVTQLLQYLNQRQDAINQTNPRLPVLGKLNLSDDVSINFLPEEDFNTLFNTRERRISPVGALLNGNIYIKLTDRFDMDYQMQAQNLNTYILERLKGKNVYNSQFEDYFNALAHELLHTQIRNNETYSFILKNATSYIQQQEDIASDLPENFKFLRSFIELGQYNKFFEEVFVYYNSGIDFFTKKLADIDFDNTNATYDYSGEIGDFVIPLTENFSRESVIKDQKYIYLFTDNANRTSGGNKIESGWYTDKYGKGNYPTKTQAVIRGLHNAMPITTMVDDKGTQWKDSQFEQYKLIIDAEIEDIKQAMDSRAFKGMKFSAQMPFGQGQISNMKETAPKIWAYLNIKLKEIGIDNTGSTPTIVEDIQTAEPMDLPEDDDTPFMISPFAKEESRFFFPNKNFGGQVKNVEDYKQIAYKPYTEIKDNNRNVISSLKKHDIVYVQWFIDGETYTSLYLVDKIKHFGSNITIEGYHVKKSLSAETEEDLVKKSIIVEYNGQTFVRKNKDGKTFSPGKVVAFRSYTGVFRNIDFNDKSTTLSEVKKAHLAEIGKNAEDWKKSQVKGSKEENIPQFIHFDNDKNSSFRFNSKNDYVGFFIKAGGNVNMTEINDLNTSNLNSPLDSLNKEKLSDASFNLLKIGDIVIYRVYNNKKKEYILHQGIVTGKYIEGITQTDLESFNPKTYNPSEDLAINRKYLHSAYIFFNEDKKKLEKSTIFEELKSFTEATRRIKEKNNEKFSETALALKSLNNLAHYDQKGFRTFNKISDDTWQLSETKSYFYPGTEQVEEVYEDGYWPTEEYYAYEKVLKSLPRQAYIYAKKNKPYDTDLKSLNLTKEQIDLLNNPNENYFNFYTAKENRIKELNGLKTGGYALIDQRSFRKEGNKFVKKEERKITYGLIVSKSTNTITVAIPRTKWDAENLKYVLDSQVPWEFVEINVTDFRSDKRYDVIRIHNNVGFEQNLIAILDAIRYNSKRNYKKSNNKNNSTAEKFEEVQSDFMASTTKAFAKNKALEGATGLRSIWHRIDFFTDNDFDSEGNSLLSDYDVEDRKTQRDRMVQMLETGSIVMYQSNPFKIERKDGTKEFIQTIRQHVVLGKDLTTGLPILTRIETISSKDKFVTKFVDTFIPDVDKIVGVGLLMESITASRLDFDGHEITLKINQNEAFKEEITSLLRTFVERTNQAMFEEKEEAEALIDEKQRKKGPTLIAKQVVDVENSFKNAQGKTVTYHHTIPLDQANTKNWSTWTQTNKHWAVFAKWKDGGISPYVPNTFRLTFRGTWDSKRKKFTQEQPAGIRIIDKIKRGTIIKLQSPNYREPISAIVLSKDDRSLTLIQPKDYLSMDVNKLTYEDAKIFNLSYRTANFGTPNKPDWRYVLPYVLEIQFTDYVRIEEFKELEAISKAWKNQENEELYEGIITDKILELSVQENKHKINMAQVRYSKDNVLPSQRESNARDLEKYQKKFEQIYGIKFELLSSNEIKERYDVLPEQNNGRFSQLKAFKFNNTIVINIDKATLEEPFHEMTHFVLEALKINDPDLYASLLQIARQHPSYHQIAARYQELSGTDLDEEVFAKVLGVVYQDKLKSPQEEVWQEENKSTLSLFFDYLKDLYRYLFGGYIDMPDRELVNRSTRDILLAFGEDLDQGKFNLNNIPSSNIKVKSGVDSVFEQNPELASIGSREQYSHYLTTIFPDSKVKDIVYHHSDTKITEFKKEFPEGYAASKGVSSKAKFFLRSPLKEEFLSKRPHLGQYLINIINPNIMPANADRSAKRDSGIKEGIQEALDNNQDGAIFDNIWDNKTWSDVLVVFNPEQIHILGSKQDIEGFEEYVKNTSSSTEQEIIKNSPIDKTINKLKEELFDNGNLNISC